MEKITVLFTATSTRIDCRAGQTIAAGANVVELARSGIVTTIDHCGLQGTTSATATNISWSETVVPIHVTIPIRTHHVARNKLPGSDSISCCWYGTSSFFLVSPARMDRRGNVAVWRSSWCTAPLGLEVVEAEEEGADDGGTEDAEEYGGEMD